MRIGGWLPQQYDAGMLLALGSEAPATPDSGRAGSPGTGSPTDGPHARGLLASGRHHYRLGGRYRPRPEDLPPSPPTGIRASSRSAWNAARATRDATRGGRSPIGGARARGGRGPGRSAARSAWAAARNGRESARADAEPARSDPRWTDRSVLVLTTITISVLAAAALTLTLLPAPMPPLRVAAEPPPPMVSVPDASTAPSTTAPAPPAPTRNPSFVGRAHAVNNRVDRPTTKAPEPAAKPSRQRPAPPRLRELYAMPAFQEGFFRSFPGGRPTTVQFVNARSATVVVHWLDFRGDRVRYHVLSPGETYRQRTYFGHPWVVTTTGGHALAVFLPVDEPARATVR